MDNQETITDNARDIIENEFNKLKDNFSTLVKEPNKTIQTMIDNIFGQVASETLVPTVQESKSFVEKVANESKH